MAKSNKAWLRRHVTDTYVRRAREAGYRSRAAYKLLEIAKDKLQARHTRPRLGTWRMVGWR
jgi:23S rRNA (uridine2552-2'-O)-methyltransferase